MSNRLKRVSTGTDQHTKNSKQFKHGNYNRYYGYRNTKNEPDKRAQLFKKEWLQNKTCLDIGCNVGHLTLYLAKHFSPRHIKGVDIDFRLIKAARANIHHYENNDGNVNSTGPESAAHLQTVVPAQGEFVEQINRSDITDDSAIDDSTDESSIRSGDMTVNRSTEEYKDLAAKSDNCLEFPKNISFVAENYVPSSANILKHTKEEYDVIFCLSVTKWIQLNSGDDGLKLTFQKVYKQLNPGGMFILEPQLFQSYKRRKNLSPEIRLNYDRIQLKPEMFVDYLLTIGFRFVEQLDLIDHEKQGFQRPVYLLVKAKETTNF